MARPDWLDNISELQRVTVPTAPSADGSLEPGVADALATNLVQRDMTIHAPTAEQIAQTIAANPTIDADTLIAGQAEADAGQNAAPTAEPAPSDGSGGASSEVTAEPDGTYKVTITDANGAPQEVILTEDQARTLILQNQWLQAQPQEVIAQWADIEAKRAVAIPAEEAAQFRAWKATGSPAAQQQQRPDLSMADPDVAAYVERLERERAAFPSTPSVDTATLPGQPNPYQIAQEAQARQAALEAVNAQFATKYNLNAQQLDALMRDTVASNAMVQNLANGRVVSPTGQVLHEADFGTALAQSYEQTMATSPALRPAFSDYIYQQRAAANAPSQALVDGKKALAGSLASTAPAAVPSVAKNPAQMNPQELRDGIAASLAERMASGTYAQ